MCLKIALLAFVAALSSCYAFGCDLEAAKEHLRISNFEEARRSYLACDTGALSAAELGQFGRATMMIASQRSDAAAMNAARELFELGARKGDVYSVDTLAELLDGEAGSNLPAEPLRARCLRAVAERSRARRLANVSTVEACLGEWNCSSIDPRLIFCPPVASPLATELGEADVVLEFTIQPSGAVSDVRVVEGRGDPRWTGEAIVALSQWQYVYVAEPTRETRRFSIRFARD